MMTTINPIIILTIVSIILIALLLQQWQYKLQLQQQTNYLQQKLSQQEQDSQRIEQEKHYWQNKSEQQQQQLSNEITSLKIELAESNILLQSERQQHDDKLTLLESAKMALSHQFQALAADILAQTGERLNQQQQVSLASLIDPFKEKLTEFKTRVEELHRFDTTERVKLSEQVNNLMQASSRVSDEANALTRAMTGQNKSQGDWGELVLERLLELAGLIEGQHYKTQHSTNNDEGTRQRPDVLLLLPENKHIIVDSKVSLTAYTRHVNSETDADATLALNEHLSSVRNHIISLGHKNYPAGKGINSPDFVILFMPVEPALLAAARADNALYEFSWQNNVLLTSPSTLLFVLRMIGQLWRNAQQQHNVQDIISRGEKLLDKFNGFSDDLDKIGSQLATTQKTYEAAKSKFDGRGGLVSQAHLLANLGIKPTKPLPQNQHEHSMLEI
jgi:DNA recombination protein RmuC